MSFNVIRGRDQGHGPVKFAKIAEIKVSFAICGGILTVVDDYDSTGQYLKLIELDSPLWLSISFHGTSKFIENAYFR